MAYAAPELLDGQIGSPEESGRDLAADMWSFGVIAFEVFTSKKIRIPY